MNNADQFDECLAMAHRVVKAYRREAPEGCDPQNSMAVIGGISAVAGAAVGIAGSVASSRAQRLQGQMANSIAQLNARQQLLNAQMQLMAVKAQEKLQKRVAEANFRLRQSAANASFANAALIDRTAEERSRVAREEIRRESSEYQREQGTLRAQTAADGVVEGAGSKGDVAAEAARLKQLKREDSLYASELDRRSLFREADMERLGGRTTLAGGKLSRDTALAEASLQAASGRAAYLSAMRDAEITRLTGTAQKQRYYGDAQGTLFSGIANGIGSLGSSFI
jgi:hypothetical protein